MITVGTIISSIATFIAGGGLASLYTLRQTKEGKELNNAAALVVEYKDLLKDYKAENKSLKEEVNALRESVNTMDLRQTRLEHKVTNTQLMLESAQLLRCNKIGCKKRFPPLDKEKLEKIGCLDEMAEDNEEVKE